jgi:RNA polymerase sigma-70 factor (ECF subfamily)
MGRDLGEKRCRKLDVVRQKLRVATVPSEKYTCPTCVPGEGDGVSFFREVQLDEGFGPLAAFRERLGFVPNLVRAQTLLPRLIEANEKLVSATLIREHALPRVQKERMALCVAATLQDTYSVTANAGILHSLGVSKSQIAQLLSDFRGAGLPASDVAQLEFCAKLSRDAQSIDSSDVESLRSYGFDDVSILETVLVCALQRFLSVLSAGLAPEPDFEPYQLRPQIDPLPSGHRSAGHESHLRGKNGPYIRTVYLSPTSFAPFAGILKTHGFIPNVFRAQTLRPDVLEATAVSVGKILMPADILTRVQKESIFVAASAAILNSYCVAAHCNLLRGLGLSPQDGDQIAIDHRQSSLPESDKTLLDFAVKLASRPSEISLPDVDRLRAIGFSDEQILECIALTALSGYINTIRIGLGVEPDFDLPPGFEQNKVHLPDAQDRPTIQDVASSVAVTEDPDAGLVAGAQAGDLEAFEKLIRRHSSTLYRALMAILGNQEEAQDAMQEALLSAFKHIGGFQGRSKFSTWLVSIARNTALQRLRNRKNLESLDEVDHEGDFRPRQIRDWHDDPEQLYSESEIRGLVEKGILGLPAKYRVVLMLRDIEQLSTEDVARQLGLSVPALKARVLRGRLMLREFLAPHFTATAGKAAI